MKIGYLPQNVVYKDEEQTVLQYFSGLHNLTYGEARAQLAKVLFLKEDVNKKIKSLSGGEKSRLRLCSLTFDGVNFMILDEPTNHLDIDSREVLEETLNEFDGTLLFVSHDRYFINKVADKIISMENSNVKVYEGDYTYYLEEYQKEIIKETEQPKKDEVKELKNTNLLNEPYKTTYKSNDKSNDKSYKSTYQIKKLEQLEQEIEKMEGTISELEESMKLHNSDADFLKKLFDEKEKVEKELELAYERWGYEN